MAVPISVGFLLGDAWAVLALKMMDKMQLNENIELYLTLFVLGGIAVIAGTLLEKIVFVPSWLCGWAIGLTILAPLGIGKIGREKLIPVHIPLNTFAIKIAP